MTTTMREALAAAGVDIHRAALRVAAEEALRRNGVDPAKALPTFRRAVLRDGAELLAALIGAERIDVAATGYLRTVAGDMRPGGGRANLHVEPERDLPDQPSPGPGAGGSAAATRSPSAEPSDPDRTDEGHRSCGTHYSPAPSPGPDPREGGRRMSETRQRCASPSRSPSALDRAAAIAGRHRTAPKTIFESHILYTGTPLGEATHDDLLNAERNAAHRGGAYRAMRLAARWPDNDRTPLAAVMDINAANRFWQAAWELVDARQ